MIKSAHLVFTQATPEDFEHFYALDSDPEIMKFIRAPSKDEAESRTRFQKLIDYNAKYNDRGAYAVRTHAGEFVGIGYMVHMELNPDLIEHEVGYRLAKKFWGRGLATEISLALIDYGFKTLKLTHINGTTNPAHVVSQKVLMKAGLKDMGTGPFYGGCRLFRIDNPDL